MRVTTTTINHEKGHVEVSFSVGNEDPGVGTAPPRVSCPSARHHLYAVSHLIAWV